MHDRASDSSTHLDLWELVPARFLLNGWFVEPLAGLLRRGETAVHVEPKVMGVLVLLAAHQGDVVSRDRFFELVWPDVVVTESALNRCVSDLRRVLGDEARHPEIIETIPKVGYRLLARVEPIPPTPARPGEGAPSRGALEPVASPFLIPEPHPGGDAAAAEHGAASSPVITPSLPALPARERGRLVFLLGALLMGVATVVAARTFLRTAPGFVETLQSAPVRVLTTLPGPEMQSVLAPDGSRVAFISQGADGTGKMALYVQSLNASAPYRLTGDTVATLWPAWAPDGRTLAFQRKLPGSDTTLMSASIYTVTEYGTDERLLATGGILFGGLSWSPDGARLAYVGQERGDRAQGIFLLDVATGARQRLTRPDSPPAVDVQPAFSPDGREVAFLRRTGEKNGDLFRVPVEGGVPTRVTFDSAWIPGFSWTPDGPSLIFSSNRAGLFQLWLAVTGEAPRRFLVPAQDPGRPSLSRAGVMAFEDWRFDTNIWITALGTASDDAHAVLVSTQWEEQPALAPDGSRVAFVSSRSGYPELWVGTTAGDELLQHTHFEGAAVEAPRWSPDGRAIAFQVYGADGYDVFTIPAGGGVPRPVTTHPAQDVNPRWSADGRSLYFGSDRDGGWDVWRAPAEGGPAERVTRWGAFVGEEDPSGTHLYVARPGEPGLYVMNLDGAGAVAAAPHRTVEALSPLDGNNWVVSVAGLFYVDRTEGAPRVMRRAEKETRPVSEPLPTLATSRTAMSVSADGRVLAWAQVDQAENDVMVIEAAPF